MKKKILVLSLLLLTACTSREKLFKEYAKTYYENHMKILENIDSATITLQDLKNASDEDGYDLSKLKKCKSNSKITFYINKQTKNIENEKIELNC